MRRGFTLIEVVISLGIFVLIAVVVIDFFISNDSLLRSEVATLSVVGQARGVMNELALYVPQASQVMDSQSFSGTTYSSGTSTVVLKLPALTSAGAIITGASDYVVIFASSTEVYEIIDAYGGSARIGGTKLLSTNLVSLSFSFEGTPSLSTYVYADIQTSQTVRKTAASTHLYEKLYLHNK